MALWQGGRETLGVGFPASVDKVDEVASKASADRHERKSAHSASRLSSRLQTADSGLHAPETAGRPRDVPSSPVEYMRRAAAASGTGVPKPARLMAMPMSTRQITPRPLREQS